MATEKINGVHIYCELLGRGGDALVLVHGSWGDHNNWGLVAGELSKTFRVLTYDRRGHSQSERPPGQGTVSEDVKDLIALTEHLGIAPAHIVGNSFGAAVVLKTAAARPDIFKTLIVHEPPLFGILKDNEAAQKALEMVNARVEAVLNLLNKNQMPEATKLFMDTLGMGPGSWEKLPDAQRNTFIYNAPTWYDEMQDPQSLQINLDSLSVFKKPALLSDGSESPPFFPLVIEKIKSAIPHAKRITIDGAGHVPHLSRPEKYVEIVTKFCLSASE
jgi:pimeloyl-ACP methyl ester carboxylesterase